MKKKKESSNNLAGAVKKVTGKRNLASEDKKATLKRFEDREEPTNMELQKNEKRDQSGRLRMQDCAKQDCTHLCAYAQLQNLDA